MLAVDVAGIKKSYFSKLVLKDVTLKLGAGRFYALVGQNGSGRSTLMRILSRQERPDQGDGFVDGIKLSADNADFFRQVASVSEQLNYDSWLSIEKFFREIGKLYPKWDENLFKAIMKELRLDLKAKFSALSRGQRIQVATAFAFAIQPKILLLDEVTAVLDPRVRGYLLQLCKIFVQRGGTVVMATNIVSKVHGIAEVLIYLENQEVKMVAEVNQLSREWDLRLVVRLYKLL